MLKKMHTLSCLPLGSNLFYGLIVSPQLSVLHALEVLPVASPPPPRQLTEEESQRLDEQEEDTLRELRLFLRDVTNRLSQDKRFKAFTKPVDLEEVGDKWLNSVLLISCYLHQWLYPLILFVFYFVFDHFTPYAST